MLSSSDFVIYSLLCNVYFKNICCNNNMYLAVFIYRGKLAFLKPKVAKMAKSSGTAFVRFLNLRQELSFQLIVKVLVHVRKAVNL